MSGMTRKPYPTDLTDDQWERVEPFLPKPKSGGRKGGRPAADTREVLNAVFYLLRGGGAWRLLPHDFPEQGGQPAAKAMRPARWRTIFGYSHVTLLYAAAAAGLGNRPINSRASPIYASDPEQR